MCSISHTTHTYYYILPCYNIIPETERKRVRERKRERTRRYNLISEAFSSVSSLRFSTIFLLCLFFCLVIYQKDYDFLRLVIRQSFVSSRVVS